MGVMSVLSVPKPESEIQVCFLNYCPRLKMKRNKTELEEKYN